MKTLFALLLLIAAVVSGAQGYMGDQKPSQADAQKLKVLEKSYITAKAAYGKKPKDAKLKKSYVDATVRFGHESMMSPVLDRSIKYRQALRLYREAMKIEPNNPVAKQESDLIIKIYQSLGRPVPKD